MQLVHSEKLASLGRMSAGIIHEINNPLNFAKTGALYAAADHGRVPTPKWRKRNSSRFCEDIGGGINRIN